MCTCCVYVGGGGGGGKTQNYLTSKSKSERGGEISRISGGGLERGL